MGVAEMLLLLVTIGLTGEAWSENCVNPRAKLDYKVLLSYTYFLQFFWCTGVCMVVDWEIIECIFLFGRMLICTATAVANIKIIRDGADFMTRKLSTLHSVVHVRQKKKVDLRQTALTQSVPSFQISNGQTNPESTLTLHDTGWVRVIGTCRTRPIDWPLRKPVLLSGSERAENLEVALKLCAAQATCLGVFDDQKDLQDLRFCTANVSPQERTTRLESTIWIKTGMKMGGVL